MRDDKRLVLLGLRWMKSYGYAGGIGWLREGEYNVWLQFQMKPLPHATFELRFQFPTTFAC